MIVIQWDMEDVLTCAEAVMSFLQALGRVLGVVGQDSHGEVPLRSNGIALFRR